MVHIDTHHSQVSATGDTQIKGFATIAANSMSGNEMPGYPIQPGPQSLHNSNGYPGYVEIGSHQSQWQQEVVSNNNQPRQNIWSDFNANLQTENTNQSSNLNWPDTDQQELISNQMKLSTKHQSHIDSKHEENISRQIHSENWTNDGVEERTSKSWPDSIDDQRSKQLQSQEKWVENTSHINDNPNSVLNSPDQQPRGWPYISSQIDNHLTTNQDNSEMTLVSTQNDWSQNTSKTQSQQIISQNNSRLTPSNQWQQHIKTEYKDSKSLRPEQSEWPDIATSQNNWSSTSVRSDNNQQPQEWTKSSSGPEHTSIHQPDMWQNEVLSNKQKIGIQKKCSSKSDNQNNWTQLNSKQDVQNSMKQMEWQQQSITENYKQNGYSEIRDSRGSIYSQSKVNLNNKLKSMILNKKQQHQQTNHNNSSQQDQQHIDYQIPTNDSNDSRQLVGTMGDDKLNKSHAHMDKFQENQLGQYLENQNSIIHKNQSDRSITGNFLSHSHHPRTHNSPEGGGTWRLTKKMTSIGLNNDFSTNVNNLSSIVTLMNFVTETGKSQEQGNNEQKEEGKNEMWTDNEPIEYGNIRNASKDNFEDGFPDGINLSKGKNDLSRETEFHQIDSLIPICHIDGETSKSKSSVDDNKVKCDIDAETKQKKSFAQRKLLENPRQMIIKMEPANKSNEDTYKFPGDGGPAKMTPESGSWCCRRGGINQPTLEHLRDGCCQGLQTKDEILSEINSKIESNSDNTTVSKTTSTGIKEHAEKLKNNIRTEVPDCDCFPSDKCKYIQYNYIATILRNI